jgi:hypothetical protein
VDLGKEGRAARVGFVVGKGLGSQWLKEAKVKEKAVAGTAGPGEDSTNYHGTKLVVLWRRKGGSLATEDIYT